MAFSRLFVRKKAGERGGKDIPPTTGQMLRWGDYPWLLPLTHERRSSASFVDEEQQILNEENRLKERRNQILRYSPTLPIIGHKNKKEEQEPIKEAEESEGVEEEEEEVEEVTQERGTPVDTIERLSEDEDVEMEF
jgi:hypothetical protein